MLFDSPKWRSVERGIKDYMQNLSKGKVFSENHWGKSKILDFKMTNPETIWVMCDVSIG
jgi:hypothetical protein